MKLLPGDGKGTYTRVAVTVTNTGKCEGEEVVQLYVRDEVASITRPIKELKGFEKIKLSPGESKTVTFDKEKGLSYAQVYKRRQKDAKPVVEGFMRWLDGQYPEKGSRMDRAVTYIRNRKDTLMTYLEDGRCSLSNNPSENSLRLVTLGRKNWLFSDSPEDANASMVVYTMVEMAKAYGLHPYNYLKYLLDSRPGTDTTDAELKDLVPWNEKARIECNKKLE